MTKEEMIRSFSNISATCKMQCPYQADCQGGARCVLREAALIMSTDSVRIAQLLDEIDILKGIDLLQLAYTQEMEARCADYYDTIKLYNEGLEEQIHIPRSKKLAAQRRARTNREKKEQAKRLRKEERELKKLKPLRDRTQMDGDPRYALRSTAPKEKYDEIFL